MKQTEDGLIQIESGEELLLLGQMAKARFDEFSKADMTEEQARQIRQWRVEEGATWRAVAQLAHEEWNGDWEPPYNQLKGEALCEKAAELLGEDATREPWN